MAWLTYAEALNAVADKTEIGGVHVFYSANRDRFSVAASSQNKTAVTDRVKLNPESYCGYYDNQFDIYDLMEDLVHVRQVARDKSRHIAGKLGKVG